MGDVFRVIVIVACALDGSWISHTTTPQTFVSSTEKQQHKLFFFLALFLVCWMGVGYPTTPHRKNTRLCAGDCIGRTKKSNLKKQQHTTK